MIQYIVEVGSGSHIKLIRYLSGKTLNNIELFDHSDDPKVGDIAFWEGHGGIVSEVDKNGNFKLIHAANSKSGVIENKHLTTASTYRKSTFYGFYRPKNETADGKEIDVTKASTGSGASPILVNQEVKPPANNSTTNNSNSKSTVASPTKPTTHKASSDQFWSSASKLWSSMADFWEKTAAQAKDPKKKEYALKRANNAKTMSKKAAEKAKKAGEKND